MRAWTYSEALSKIEDDLDLREENFITPTEMLGYFNEAIDEAEAHIHKLGVEDQYFETSAPITLTSGAGDLDMPSDIYAEKILKLIYANGTDIYPINRLRGLDRHERFIDIRANYPSLDYQYMLDNSTADGVLMKLAPLARETGAGYVTMWYIRNAARVTTGTDVFDIPEFMNFILQYVKVRCKEKEGTLTPADVGALDHERELMMETLTERTPDEDNVIVADMSHYEEHQ